MSKLTRELLEHILGKQQDAHRHRSGLYLTRDEADALIAAARASLESRSDAADKFVALRTVWENCPDSDMDPFTEFCRHFDWSPPKVTP